MNTTIYLADLTHNYTAKGPFTVPINVGYITSYAKMIYGKRIQVKLFKFPQDLMDAVKEQSPDILGLSNYTWNLDINNKILSWVKSLSKDTVTVFGGPDLPVVEEEQKDYLKKRPDLDFYVLHQGEKGFTSLLERFFSSAGSIEKMKSSPVNNCSFYDAESDEMITGSSFDMVENLQEIPSPYLSGILDDFFTDNMIPLIETNRGCPFSCSFCAWGTSSQKKVLPFPVERIEEEIKYISHRVKNIDLLMMGDANFGILPRDIDIAKIIRRSKDACGYPSYINVTWAKDGSKRLMTMIDILGDIVAMHNAFGSFQSLDPTVTKNIKRNNLPLNEFNNIQSRLKEKNVTTSSELILGLPGETKVSHLEGLKSMFDFNASSICCYNLRMIGGSELNSLSERKKFGIKTKYRLIDGGFGKYNDILSIEHEEMVLSTNTMTMNDILYFRPIHFLIQFLWNYKYYEELLVFLKHNEINPVDFITALIDKKRSVPPGIERLFNDFKDESYEEWFDTEQYLIDRYSKPENFELISRGSFGKLNFKYTYRILLEYREDFDKHLYRTTIDMLEERGIFDPSKKEQLDEVFRYGTYRYIDPSEGFDDLESYSETFKYDMLKWRNEGYQRPLSEYATNGTPFSFSVPSGQAAELTRLYRQYQGVDLNQTLRKMAEYMNDRDLFRRVKYSS